MGVTTQLHLKFDCHLCGSLDKEGLEFSFTNLPHHNDSPRICIHISESPAADSICCVSFIDKDSLLSFAEYLCVFDDGGGGGGGQ